MFNRSMYTNTVLFTISRGGHKLGSTFFNLSISLFCPATPLSRVAAPSVATGAFLTTKGRNARGEFYSNNTRHSNCPNLTNFIVYFFGTFMNSDWLTQFLAITSFWREKFYHRYLQTNKPKRRLKKKKNKELT